MLASIKRKPRAAGLIPWVPDVTVKSVSSQPLVPYSVQTVVKKNNINWLACKLTYHSSGVRLRH